MGAAGARTFLLGVKWIASEQTYNFVIYSRHGEQMTHVRVSASRWTRALSGSGPTRAAMSMRHPADREIITETTG